MHSFYFNSIKVQLEHAVALKKTQNSLFQFHKGTIRTLVRFGYYEGACNFNSIKVQLEPVNP